MCFLGLALADSSSTAVARRSSVAREYLCPIAGNYLVNLELQITVPVQNPEHKRQFDPVIRTKQLADGNVRSISLNWEAKTLNEMQPTSSKCKTRKSDPFHYTDQNCVSLQERCMNRLKEVQGS